MSDYTDIIVGGGSAGAVIAARLSDDPSRRILLIEAGPDFPTDNLPEDMRNGLYPSFSAHDWGYMATAVPGREILLSRGKVMGGCSAINTSLAVRPDAADFEEWKSLGLNGWGWDDVLPYFRKLETDRDFGETELHGGDGPITYQRWGEDQLIPLQKAWRDTLLELGFARVDDLNGGSGSGAAVLPQNLVDGRRISTTIGYLDPVRNRDNLTIMPDTMVDNVEVRDGRAVAVRVLQPGGGRHSLSGDRIVLSAGAIGTPAILLRSGIGDAAALDRLGVPVVADLPGVGRNLWDHPACMIVLKPKPGVCDMTNPVCQILLRYTAEGSPIRDDMQIYLYSQIDLGGYAKELQGSTEDNLVFMISVGIERPVSSGTVTLTSLDPEVAPTIDLNFLSEEEDRRRMRDGMRKMWQVAQHPNIQAFAEGMVAPTPDVLDSDQKLDEYDAGCAMTHYHPAGTAKMGPRSDRQAVLDERCRVHGVENLLVADASVMPTMIRANTNLTCIAIGEKVADELLKG